MMSQTEYGKGIPLSSNDMMQKLRSSADFGRPVVDVSLVVPMHNSSGFLADLFESLDRLSTFPRQVIVHDDASSDASLEVARKLLMEYPWGTGVELIFAKTNRGVAGSYNYLADCASSVWTHILDADDWFSGDFYRRLNMEKRGADCVAIVGGACCNQHMVDLVYRFFSFVLGERRLPSWLPVLGLITTRSALVYRTEVLRSVRFPEPAYDGSDIVHLLEVHKKGSVIFSPAAKIGYRVHEGSATNKMATLKYWQELRSLAPGGLFLLDFLIRKRLFSFLRRRR